MHKTEGVVYLIDGDQRAMCTSDRKESSIRMKEPT